MIAIQYTQHISNVSSDKFWLICENMKPLTKSRLEQFIISPPSHRSNLSQWEQCKTIDWFAYAERSSHIMRAVFPTELELFPFCLVDWELILLFDAVTKFSFSSLNEPIRICSVTRYFSSISVISGL